MILCFAGFAQAVGRSGAPDKLNEQKVFELAASEMSGGNWSSRFASNVEPLTVQNQRVLFFFPVVFPVDMMHRNEMEMIIADLTLLSTNTKESHVCFFVQLPLFRQFRCAEFVLFCLSNSDTIPVNKTSFDST